MIKHIQKYTERNLINNTLLIETKLKDNKLQIMIFSNLKEYSDELSFFMKEIETQFKYLLLGCESRINKE